MKNQVYSWRLDAELKSALEEVARNSNTSVSALLEVIVTEWLKDQHSDESDSAFQKRLHESALECFGTIKGGVPGRSENARQAIRDRMTRRRAG